MSHPLIIELVGAEQRADRLREAEKARLINSLTESGSQGRVPLNFRSLYARIQQKFQNIHHRVQPISVTNH
jgi:hypothetical protein